MQEARGGEWVQVSKGGKVGTYKHRWGVRHRLVVSRTSVLGGVLNDRTGGMESQLYKAQLVMQRCWNFPCK